MSMAVSNHPELATLQNYLANSAADEFAGLRLHLAQCSSCRELVTGLSGAEQMTQHTAANYSGADGLTEQQHQNIVDYIDNRLAENERLQQKEFIQANAAAMKAALHYASHKSAMDKALSGSKADAARQSNEKINKSIQHFDLWNTLKDLVTIKAPVWLTVPATAALVALLSINLFNQPEIGHTGYTIASYQDNPVIQFRAKEAQPGIGFFARPSQSAEPYKAVRVSVSEGNRFTIHWPPVTGAVIYNLRLQMFNQGSKLVVGEVTTKNNSAVITADLDNIYHRYEWVLSGETSDNRAFISSGGFVINHTEQGVLK
ncbi:MAG: hypothetical protein HYZ31_06255 [Gammaproteobacteria bacterium]|nr:hypothetical protein [Gammaproteobacteria bacterium]